MITKTVFRAEQFTPTKFSTAEDKAKFANQFIKFVESKFSLEQFPEWFYNRLSMTFGYIAHNDRMGFYNTFFTTVMDRIDFIKHTIHADCFGQPEFTYSDVEKALIKWIKDELL